MWELYICLPVHEFLGLSKKSDFNEKIYFLAFGNINLTTSN